MVMELTERRVTLTACWHFQQNPEDTKQAALKDVLARHHEPQRERGRALQERARHAQKGSPKQWATTSAALPSLKKAL